MQIYTLFHLNSTLSNVTLGDFLIDFTEYRALVPENSVFRSLFSRKTLRNKQVIQWGKITGVSR